ncbi:MAG: hypothetical protein LBV27_08015, partial [Oscillospiraceae bacterium]|nr:hypothetical protein [Oscillospiraceae bacterium]
LSISGRVREVAPPGVLCFLCDETKEVPVAASATSLAVQQRPARRGISDMPRLTKRALNNSPRGKSTGYQNQDTALRGEREMDALHSSTL